MRTLLGVRHNDPPDPPSASEAEELVAVCGRGGRRVRYRMAVAAVMWIVALITAPIVGVSTEDLHVLHAVTRETLGANAETWETLRSIPAACGAEVQLLEHESGDPMSWPIPTKLAPTMQRCSQCRRVCGGRIDWQWWQR